MGLNWQSRCAVFPLENNRASVDDATETWQGDDLHRKGTTPRRKRPCCVRSCGVNPNVPPSRPRGIVELLVKPPRANTLIPFPLSFSISPFSSLRPFFFHWSLCSLLHSIPSTNSCGNPLSYSSYFTITISGSSRFSSSYRTLSIRSLIKYICLTGTYTREHAHLIITRTDRIIPAETILTTSYDCFRNSFIFYQHIDCYRTLLNLPRILTLFVLWNNIICLVLT